MRKPCFYIAILLFCALVSTAQAAPRLEYRVLKESPHDPRTFTQGLVLDGEDFIESSGQYGRSWVRRYRAATNERIQEIALPQTEFAEGLALVGEYVYLLTWREHTLYILQKDSLKPRFKLTYEGEGWGLAWNGSQLLMSNGSDRLFFRDPKTFKVNKTLEVRDGDKAVRNLNELEYAWDSIWANVWREDRILRIDPSTGKVLGELQLADLVKRNGGNINRVLNGIAWDRSANALWITGKYWPRRYLIEVDLNPPGQTQKASIN